MSTTHTAGPLLVEDGTLTLSAPPRASGRGGLRAYREPVAEVPSNTINREGNARRLAAAWNACEGIATDGLERMSAGAIGNLHAENTKAWIVYLTVHKACEAAGFTLPGEGGRIDMDRLTAAISAKPSAPITPESPDLVQSVAIRRQTTATREYNAVTVCLANLHLSCDLVNDRQIGLAKRLADSHGASFAVDPPNADRVAEVLARRAA